MFVYRGRVVPVVDLHALAGVGECPPHLSSRIILFPFPLDVPESLVGLLATQVCRDPRDQAGHRAADPRPGRAPEPRPRPRRRRGHPPPARPRLAALAGRGRVGRADRSGVRAVTDGAIDTVVRERLGLDPLALGPHVLGRAVEGRMHARGLADPAVYASRLMTEPAERGALAADLVVSETWFFRGGRRCSTGWPRSSPTAPPAGRRATGPRPEHAVQHRGGAVLAGDRAARAVPHAGRVHHRRGRSVRARAWRRRGPRGTAAFAFREIGADIRPPYFRAAGGAVGAAPAPARRGPLPARAT